MNVVRGFGYGYDETFRAAASKKQHVDCSIYLQFRVHNTFQWAWSAFVVASTVSAQKSQTFNMRCQRNTNNIIMHLITFCRNFSFFYGNVIVSLFFPFQPVNVFFILKLTHFYFLSFLPFNFSSWHGCSCDRMVLFFSVFVSVWATIQSRCHWIMSFILV